MIGSLTARIFAIFWLTLALVLMLVLMLPKLDSRQMTELLESEQRQGIMIEQHVEAELANDPPKRPDVVASFCFAPSINGRLRDNACCW
ncbi:Copper sensory histidine kinase CpxA [Klebsiella pneumoniae IS39]|nr:Copper sensory histidine kinase CpxA [Klebsiella pneumoniae IS39]